MKLGRWMARDGSRVDITYINTDTAWKWRSLEHPTGWSDSGHWNSPIVEDRRDLVRYLGPIELSPTPACAEQAGTPVVSPVSTETAGEQLRRMRQRYNAMDREASIYSGLLAALDQAKSDLDERIRAMEKEHDL